MSSAAGKSLGVDPADDFEIDDIMPKERGVIQPFAEAAPLLTHRLLWDDQMDDEKPMEWLIRDILPHGVLAVLYGHPGVGKSFFALDWAFSVATNHSWCGHPVVQGDVVYVCAEGWRGMKDRVAAWKARRSMAGFDRTGVAFLGKPLRLLDDRDVRAFADSIEGQTEEAPRLIIIDTLARNAVGLDENSATQMGQVVSAGDYLRERFDATVLMLHHSTKSVEGGPSLRGSGALKAAIDTLALVTEKDGMIRLYCEKQKDAPKFATKYFKMAPVGRSIVLAQTTPVEKKKRSKDEPPEDDGYPEPTLGIE